jgi:hypothetical protein
MNNQERNEEREERIAMEIVVDAYDEIERALGWYYYLDNMLSFPFRAECIAKRATSPLRVGEKVEVIGMPSEEDCEHEMFVTIRWKDDSLAVPLAQLRDIDADAETRQAIEDWHYWVRRGYAL